MLYTREHTARMDARKRRDKRNRYEIFVPHKGRSRSTIRERGLLLLFVAYKLHEGPQRTIATIEVS